MRERAKGGWGRTPEHACPLVAVCRQGTGNAAADFQALLHEQSRGFCLLHHLFLLEGAFHLCIHLNSKEALKKKHIKGWCSLFIHKCSDWDLYLKLEDRVFHNILQAKLRFTLHFKWLISFLECCLQRDFDCCFVVVIFHPRPDK